MSNSKRRIQFILGLIIVAIFVVSVSLFSRPEASGELKIYFFDVGQGDASYIKTPSGEDILIDGGGDSSVLNELGKVMDFGDKEISLVILTHPHADHLTGLLEVLRRYKVTEVWETGVEYSSATYDSWDQEISSQNISSRVVKVGDSKEFGRAKILVLYPLSSLENKNVDNLNNASIVNRLEYEKFSVLFTGDAEKNVQSKLINQQAGGKDLFATVLKVAHHGSENGLTEDFLKVVRPAIAIISAGKDNKYGHPHAEALNLLKSYAVRIFRTDQNGTIEVSSDGEGYWVRSP